MVAFRQALPAAASAATPALAAEAPAGGDDAGRQGHKTQEGEVQELRQGQPGGGREGGAEGRDVGAPGGQLLRRTALHPRIQSEREAPHEATEEGPQTQPCRREDRLSQAERHEERRRGRRRRQNETG